jgi:hypothetical protein
MDGSHFFCPSFNAHLTWLVVELSSGCETLLGLEEELKTGMSFYITRRIFV